MGTGAETRGGQPHSKARRWLGVGAGRAAPRTSTRNSGEPINDPAQASSLADFHHGLRGAARPGELFHDALPNGARRRESASRRDCKESSAFDRSDRAIRCQIQQRLPEGGERSDTESDRGCASPLSGFWEDRRVHAFETGRRRHRLSVESPSFRPSNPEIRAFRLGVGGADGAGTVWTVRHHDRPGLPGRNGAGRLRAGAGVGPGNRGEDRSRRDSGTLHQSRSAERIDRDSRGRGGVCCSSFESPIRCWKNCRKRSRASETPWTKSSC